MSNRIQHLEIYDRVLSPVQSEVWLQITLDQPSASAEIRGRLVGPICRYASTVEVAYGLLPLWSQPDKPGVAGATLSRRVIIPEASFWEPESPFLYQGPVELWDEGRRCDVVPISHGLRQVVSGRDTLHVNGRSLTLQGLPVSRLDEPRALALRTEGYNLLVTRASFREELLWSLADEVGFFVLGTISGEEEISSGLLRQLASHPSALGWVVTASLWEADPDRVMDLLQIAERSLVGLELDTVPEHYPAGLHFLIGSADQAAELITQGTLSADFSPLWLLTGEADSLPELVRRMGRIKGKLSDQGGS